MPKDILERFAVPRTDRSAPRPGSAILNPGLSSLRDGARRPIGRYAFEIKPHGSRWPAPARTADAGPVHPAMLPACPGR